MASQKQQLMALLGLLAVAGYKNRDKITDMLGKAKEALPQASGGADGGLASDIGGMFGGASAGDNLSGGLGEMMDRFNKAGHGKTADSWIGQGANQDLPEQQMEQAIGSDMLADLSAKTGLSAEDILSRLSADLPGAVNDMTPQGRLPTGREAGGLFG